MFAARPGGRGEGWKRERNSSASRLSGRRFDASFCNRRESRGPLVLKISLDIIRKQFCAAEPHDVYSRDASLELRMSAKFIYVVSHFLGVTGATLIHNKMVFVFF